MFETPYQTTPCARFKMEKTFAGIRRLDIHDELVTLPGSLTGVKAVAPGESDWPPFNQPITQVQIDNLSVPAVIDGSRLLRANGRAVTDDALAHAVLNADLTVLWLRNEKGGFRKDLLNLGTFPLKVFSNWIGNAIALRLQLDPSQAYLTKAMAVVYYIQLCTPLSEHPTADEIDVLMIRAARALPATDALTLAGVLGEIPRIRNILEFVSWVVKVLDTPRAEQLDGPAGVGFIYTAVGFSWGVEYREMVAIALEYPPTFTALLYSTLASRSYKKTGLGRITDNLISRQEDREYIKNVDHLIGRR